MSNLEKALKEIELESKVEELIQKYSKETVYDFLEWVLTLSDSELKATVELYEIIEDVESNKQKETTNQ